MAVKRLLYLLSVFSFANLSPVLKDGYQIGCLKCHRVDAKKLNIHLVPHSHDDVGWLKTVDQYYYGLNNTIQYASVQYIITSVVDALLQNADRRYMQVETAFFWKWWNDQTDDMRSKFKSLVDNGQIEMVNGAWSMNDEACTNYQSTIDQFAWGLRLINQTVGSCGTPRVGWQIDPFGHSREQASLFAQLGYDGLFFSRLDHADQLTRRKESTSEFVWQGSSNLDNTAIFGSILPNGYGPPNGFCWDISCSDDPIDDGIDSPDNNVQTIRESFIKNMKEYSMYYKTKNVFLPMGEDFQYSAAEAYYINIDRLIKIFNNDSDINVLYSTPSCYIKAVNDAQPKLPLKIEDFFPYSSEEHSYWAGYFTSRPNSKRFERIGNNILQAAKQLYALASYNFTESPYESKLRYLREAMGNFQHHDAITGTEKQHVANDYVRQLHRGIKKVEEGISSVIQDLIGINDTDVHLELSSCLLANISICAVSQSSEKMLVLVYNPLSWNVSHYVRLPVENSTFTIQGPDGQEEYDLAPALSDFTFVMLTGEKPCALDLVFYAKNLPALGFKIYYIEKTKKNEGYTNPDMEANTNTFGWQNKYFTVDNTSHLLQSVYLNGISLNITQNFYYYNSATRDEFTFIKYIRDAPKSAVSGAYLFRPNNTEAVELTGLSSKFFNGSLVKEYWQKWKNTEMDITQIIRVYKDEDYIEFDWMVGNIKVGDNKTGKEVITRFTVSDEFNSSNTFYTDSNGRELIQRIKDHHSDYSYNASIEPVASNYYPITSKILIKDEKKNIEVAILNDRAQGGSSLNSGEIELMVHRRLFRDDYKGVGEPLNETEFGDVGIYVRGSHYLILGKSSGANSNGLTTAAQERILAHKKLLQPWIMLSNTAKIFSDLEKIVTNSYPGLLNPLPDNINVLTFEPWINNTYILRLENIFEKNEDFNLSTTSTVSLKNLFKHFAIKDLTEMTLGANTLLAEINKRQKYTWQLDDKSEVHFEQVEAASNMDITLTPMQIRTFIVTLKPLKHNFGYIIQPSLVLISMLFFVNLGV